MHPQIGAHGVRLFDIDEVTAVAANIAQSGRALERTDIDPSEWTDDTDDERIEADRQRSELIENYENQLSEISHRLSRTERGLQRQQARNNEWRAEVENAVAALVSSLDGDPEDLLVAATELVQTVEQSELNTNEL